jgi:anthranilate phosphoribosyltransferase
VSDLRDILATVVDGRHLTEAQARRAMEGILAGEVDPAWIAGLLVALRIKGETSDEITGFARAMRGEATPVRCATPALVDTCGTGGDGAGTFNISTAAAFVAAGAGAHVAKHGNRSVSSRCGSADVLEALGVNLQLAPEVVGEAIDTIGFGFLFAPALHQAMRHAVGPRRALGLRTVFNVLGPLTNPAGAPHQVMGVFDEMWLDPLAEVMRRLGNARSLLVHGSDGLDELTVTGPSRAVLVDGSVSRLEVDPAELGLGPHEVGTLRGGDASDNARVLRAVLQGRLGAARDVVVLNAGAALWTCGRADSLAEGCELAARSIDAREALDRLDAYVSFSQAHGGAS